MSRSFCVKLATTTAASTLVLAAPSALSAQDQDVDEVAVEEDDEFIGTVDIGSSTRAVQTGTEVARTVVDREEIEDRQANTIAELVDSIPSVSLVNGSTPIGSSISIRGFGFNSVFGTDNKVQIRIDGAAADAEEIYRVGNQIFTDPSLYKSVDVIRGTVGSFEYGSGIIGGVIRLETIDALDLTGGEPGYAASQTFGYFTNEDGFQSSTTVALAPSEKFEVLANYSYREQANQTDGDGNEIGNGEFELPSFLIKARTRFGPDNEHSLVASFQQTTTADRDVPLDTFITATDFFGNVDRDTKSQAVNFRYNWNPIDNDLIDFTAQMAYTNQDIDQTFIPGSTNPPGFDAFVSNLGNADLQFEIYQGTLKNGSIFKTGGITHNLRAGMEFRSRVRADANSAPGGTDDRLAFFLIDQIELARGLTVTPAIRYESSDIVAEPGLDDGSFFDTSNSAWMGGISGRYEFPFGLAFFASWAQTDSLPILDDLESAILINQIEEGETIEFGASYDSFGVFGQNDRLAVKVNYYDSQVDNLTTTRGVDRVDTKGFEAELSYAAANGFYVDFNASIISADEIAPDGTVSVWRNIPHNTYQASVGKRFSDWLNIRWESVIAEERDRNGDVFDGFDFHTARAIISPQKGVFEGLELRVSVENIFDSLYRPIRSLRNSPGRNFKFTVAKLF
ncbi:MAG: TonB-dependent receptor [Pseudomonadota bacterium]